MTRADKTFWKSWDARRARRILLYHYGLISVLGAVVGICVAVAGDWSRGLTLALGANSGMTVCARPLLEELANDVRRLLRRRRHGRYA